MPYRTFPFSAAKVSILGGSAKYSRDYFHRKTRKSTSLARHSIGKKPCLPNKEGVFTFYNKSTWTLVLPSKSGMDN
jgi:hypothetical protein